MAEENLSLSDYRALAEFRYQVRRILRLSEDVARAADLEPQQHQLLLAIKGLPEGRKATIGELAERLQLRHHSTVELVDRLAKRGLVRRQHDEEDQRRVIVSLTPPGEALLHSLSHQMLAELGALGPTIVQALNALLISTDRSEGVPTSSPSTQN